MSRFRSKFNKYDKTFSAFIVLRDGPMCQRCGKIKGLQCSHIFGRANMATRCDPDNAKGLCVTCHEWWHSNPPLAYEWLVGVIGQPAYDRLRLKANSTSKMTEWEKDLIRAEQTEFIKQMERGEFKLLRFNPAFIGYPR